MKLFYKQLIALLTIVIASTTVTWAQNAVIIKGQLIDSVTQNGVAYATITLKDSLQKPVKAVLSESDGRFSIRQNKAGDYTLDVAFVGYTPVSKKIKIEGQNIDLGKLLISEGIEIGQVTVVAQLVTTDIDKTTYNTSADPETPALTAIEMMRKVPLLTVDGEDNILLRGQSNFKILINGKASTMMNKNYKEILKSMPASSIKNVEVITNPPAKYDAEGVGGIINIITERKSTNGYNGSLNAFTDTFGSIAGGGYASAQFGKFNVSANLFFGDSKQPDGRSSSSRENFSSIDSRYSNNSSKGKGSGQFYGANIEASYEIDTFNLITLAFWGNKGDFASDYTSFNEYMNVDGKQTSAYRGITKSNNVFGYVSGNIDYQKTFKKPDQTFTVSYKLDYNPSASSYTNDMEEILNFNSYSQKSENTATGAEHTFQADYFNPINKYHQVETGIKYILRPNTSNTENYLLHNQEWIRDDSRKNDLDYNQHIASAYAGYQFKYKKFSTKLGLRAEYTINDGVFKLKEDQSMFNRFFNIVPYVTFGFKPTDSQNIRLGYTQRLSRPSIWYLNPYVNDENPMEISTGNPNLTSEIGNNFDASYSIYKQKFNINVSGSANFVNNSIEQISKVLANGAKFTTYENIGIRQSYTLSFYGSTNFFNQKLRINLSGNAGYSIINTNNDSGLKNQGWNFGGNLGIYAQTWKNGSVNLNGGIFSSRVELEGSQPAYYYSTIGVNQQVFNKKVRIGLALRNPWSANQTFTAESKGLDFVQTSTRIQAARALNLNISWNFGKMQTQVKKARRGISNDDVKSGGNSSGGAATGGGTGGGQ